MSTSRYEVEDYDLREMQDCELELFDEFCRICEAHKIPYYLAYGTLLGAARHEGFIPWDDDIDVFVFAHDLERLRHAMEQDLNQERFFYQCEETEPAFNMTITRLRLNNSCALNLENADRDIHQGVYIDIYPLHEMAESKLGRMWQKFWAMVNCLLTVHRPPLNHGTLGQVAYKLGMLLFDHPGVKEHARRQCTRYMGRTTSITGSLCSDWGTISRDFPTSIFEPSRLPFEGRSASVPSGWDQMLRIRYGAWQELPPEDERHGVHLIYFFDPDHSYERYKGSKYLLD